MEYDLSRSLLQRPRHVARRYQSSSTLYELDGIEHVEYVRGVGQVKTRVPQPDAEEEVTEFPESSSHAVVQVLPTDDTGIRGSLDWLLDSDRVFMKFAEEILLVAGDEIKRVEYSEHPPVFLLDIRSEGVSRDVWFKVLGENCHKLRSVLSRRIGATAVDRRGYDELVQKIGEIRHDVAQRQVPGVTLHFTTAPTVDPATQLSTSAIIPPPSTPRRVPRSTARSRTASEATGQLQASQACITTEVSTTDICVGCLVLRMREYGKKKSYKLDEDDVFDGPFKVVELSADLGSPPRTRGKRRSAPGRLGGTKDESSALVKLDLPHDRSRRSRGLNPWTAIGRLRRAYIIPPLMLNARVEESPKKVLERILKTQASSVVNGLSDPDNTWTVAQLGPDNFVKHCYISPNCIGDDEYEVEKLRGKRIDRVNIKDLPPGFTVQNDSDIAITKFLAQGGKLPAHQILVVRYLVHWASWPSEDDSWEIATGNLPAALIEEFERKNMGAIQADVPPNSPPRKRRR